MKNVIPGVSRGETANNRVLVAREFTGTRAPNTRESKSATRTRPSVNKESLYSRAPGVFLKWVLNDPSNSTVL